MISTQSKARKIFAYIENPDKRPCRFFQCLIVLLMILDPLVIVVYSFIWVPSFILKQLINSIWQQEYTAREARTSGEEILTFRIFVSIISLLSQTDSVRINIRGVIYIVNDDDIIPSITTWIPFASNFSARAWRAALVPLLASYMTTCPPRSKKSQINCSHPSEVFLRKAIVSALFSPTCENQIVCQYIRKREEIDPERKRVQHLVWNSLMEAVALLQWFSVYNHPETRLASWSPSIADTAQGLERCESCLVLEVQLWWLESFRHETEAPMQ